MKKYLGIVSLIVLMASCRKDKTTTVFDLGKNYFPREVGAWVVYDVDSIIHDDNDGGTGNRDTIRFQLKEMIESEFVDNSGNTNQRIERYIKLNDTSQWKIQDVWTSFVNSQRAEQVEENNRFIKLIFPTKEGNSWNGNSYTNLDEWLYEYESVDVTDTINGTILDSVLTVVQQDEVLVIERTYYEEKYARGIGRVSRTNIFLDIQNESGFEVYETINSYGN